MLLLVLEKAFEYLMNAHLECLTSDIAETLFVLFMLAVGFWPQSPGIVFPG